MIKLGEQPMSLEEAKQKGEQLEDLSEKNFGKPTNFEIGKIDDTSEITKEKDLNDEKKEDVELTGREKNIEENEKKLGDNMKDLPRMQDIIEKKKQIDEIVKKFEDRLPDEALELKFKYRLEDKDVDTPEVRKAIKELIIFNLQEMFNIRNQEKINDLANEIKQIKRNFNLTEGDKKEIILNKDIKQIHANLQIRNILN
jgi:hypothetical protein